MITQYAEKLKKLPGPLYKAAAQIYIDKIYPRHLFIETTASCNLKCDYCPRERINNHMDFELFKSIIDESAYYGPRSFSLHLFGEPLLYPRVWEAVRYIKTKNKQNTVILTSNGTLFERHADDIVKSDVDKIIWSWRPEAKFSDKLKERLRKWGRLTVRMIQETVPKEEKDYWGNWPNVETRSLHNYGGTVDLKKFGVQGTAGTRYPCYHLWLAPAVAWNGNFLICCSDPHQKEVIGNLADISIAEGWQKMEKIRQAHLNGQYNGICKDCDVWKSYPDLFFKWQKK